MPERFSLVSEVLPQLHSKAVSQQYLSAANGKLFAFAIQFVRQVCSLAVLCAYGIYEMYVCVCVFMHSKCIADGCVTMLRCVACDL